MKKRVVYFVAALLLFIAAAIQMLIVSPTAKAVPQGGSCEARCRQEFKRCQRAHPQGENCEAQFDTCVRQCGGQ